MPTHDSAVAARQDAPLESAALARVIAEVRTGPVQVNAGAYNRTYNRHTR
jgi:hypothetical protein